MKDRRAMVETRPNLSQRRQCELLRVNRASLYYEPEPQTAQEVQLLTRIDALHLKLPFYGSRKVTQQLRAEGVDINRKRVQRLMRLLDIQALVPGPNTSKASPEHAVFPYLLRDLTVTRTNQVWAADITYIPMAQGFLYLVAIMDWHSRRVLSWELSSTLHTDFCMRALDRALCEYGAPEIFNTDQGSQFTATAFVNTLLNRGIKVSMDGKGRCIDNVFVERLWRALKYEEVYLNVYDSVPEARARIGAYFDFYNNERFHQALGYQTPAAFYKNQIAIKAA